MNRRDALKGIGALVGGASAGCGAVPFADHSPDDLLAGIDTFVVLMLENRSFDHVFGARRLLEGRAIDGLTGRETNPDLDGNPVGVSLLENFHPADPPHDWDDAHAQWNGGANDGFVRLHAGPSQHEAMGFHIREHLPVSYALADEFTVFDRWHASVLGPTFPNRYYLHGASAGGLHGNVPLPGLLSIFDVLDDAGVSSASYYHDLPFASAYLRTKGLFPIERFFADAAAGSLPRFCMLDPKWTGPDANDDHPEKDIRMGQALIGSVYAALAASPQWSRCLLLVTYDENGGFFDHVAPGTTVDERPEFRQLGFRVPAIAVGPKVRSGAVVSTPVEHVSVIATLTRRYSLQPLKPRVEATADLSVCVDPALADGLRRAPRMPVVTLSRSELRGRLEAGERHRSHPELQDIADQGDLPRALDRRGDAEVIARVLEAGERLGAVRLVD